MDGDYFSIYPYDLEKRLYTVTSVRHGVVWRGDVGVGVGVGAAVGTSAVETVRAAIEAEITEIFPTFPTHASYHSCFLSWKTKPVTEEDDRSLRYSVEYERRTLSLYGGKITGIFDASRRVLETLGLH
jgi:hypothetical protein